MEKVLIYDIKAKIIYNYSKEKNRVANIKKTVMEIFHTTLD